MGDALHQQKTSTSTSSTNLKHVSLKRIKRSDSDNEDDDMPGILPMKVIKVGSHAQSRIAQACDRCRSKKIRCDGMRPSCTQCVNVGFECKTSDKLSRRAFPRGYTESLEERVRALENEIRELKDLLDEKDEKIDLLSRLHSSRSPMSKSPARSPTTQHTTAVRQDNKNNNTDEGETFKVQQSPMLAEDDNCDPHYVGTSSGRTVVDALKRKAQESGKCCEDIHPDEFFHLGSKSSESPHQGDNQTVFKAPPRLVSDQLVNIFFQEWAPLFPIVHRPTFLKLYEDYVSDPEEVQDKKSLALLNLVFSIASLSNDGREHASGENFEEQWHAATEAILMDNSLITMQCLILAQVSCILSGDYPHVHKYRGLAVSLSHRLGLHQSQKRFALGALTMETRKKVFWTLYTVDCLVAAQLGCPRLFKEDDVHCEYPVDVDDEYVTEDGFLPTLPGEATKLSSALALFRGSRILASALSQLYPSSTSHEISFSAVNSLCEELEGWHNGLPQHLRLHFSQGKPATNITGSRSPVLSLMYHYIRILINRPVVCADLGVKASSALLAMADSCKSTVQIIELLEERTLSFSISLNKDELMSLCGFGFLFQTINTDHQGQLYKDSTKLIGTVTDILDRRNAPQTDAFRRVAGLVLVRPQEDPQPQQVLQITHEPPQDPPQVARHYSEGYAAAPVDTAFRATQKHLKAIASCFSPSMARMNKETKDTRRATVPALDHQNLGVHPNQSTGSLNSIRSEPPHMARSEPTLSPNSQRASLTPRGSHKQISSSAKHNPNLDYLSFDAYGHPIPANYGLSSHVAHNTANGRKSEVSAADWEKLLGSIDNGNTNIYDTIYGGQPAEALTEFPQLTTANTTTSNPENLTAWSNDLWTLGYGIDGSNMDPPGQQAPPSTAAPQSVLSFSDDSLTSGEEFGPLDFPSVGSSDESGNDTATMKYPGLVMPAELSPAGYGMDGQAFGL